MSKHDAVFYNDAGIIEYKAGNTDKAIEYWQHAALNGNVNAMFELGVAELQASVTTSALLKAREWFNCAMQQGHRNAALQIEKIDLALEKGDLSLSKFKESLLNNIEKPDYLGKDLVTFGGIEWLILFKTDNRMLCLSADIITVLPYNETLEKTSWENCSLRKWLNTEFVNRFTEEEKNRIIRLDYGKCGFLRNNGNPKNDRVFLLSVEEVERLFDCSSSVKSERFDLLSKSDTVSDLVAVLNLSDQEIKSINERTGHDYSLINGKSLGWWLRDTGIDSACAVRVNCRGVIRLHGRAVNRNLVGVRPAIWLRGE